MDGGEGGLGDSLCAVVSVYIMYKDYMGVEIRPCTGPSLSSASGPIRMFHCRLYTLDHSTQAQNEMSSCEQLGRKF